MGRVALVEKDSEVASGKSGEKSFVMDKKGRGNDGMQFCVCQERELNVEF